MSFEHVSTPYCGSTVNAYSGMGCSDQTEVSTVCIEQLLQNLQLLVCIQQVCNVRRTCDLEFHAVMECNFSKCSFRFILRKDSFFCQGACRLRRRHAGHGGPAARQQQRSQELHLDLQREAGEHPGAWGFLHFGKKVS